MTELKINNSIIRLLKGDMTAMEVESIVFYASRDLKLGAGFGNAIAVRGGLSIQEELKKFGTIQTGEAVVTSAGAMKCKFIIHAAGPRFQETDTEQKLCETIDNVLNLANERGFRQIVFPPMGTGFYGISLDTCSTIMIERIKKHLANNTSLKEVIICVIDEREYKPFKNILEANN